ncbi:CYTH and CHAD domain-containing protein [Skermanella stibiiresistens]|uniref:CYTH and CHAD domain-containing protein n=1 Tax=Skermanella stibiiresistens TaxID=913326 RepID=UPI0006874B49|nr:CYTH and CHAD domain-containing protein [Skermanella stibiiresistens]
MPKNRDSAISKASASPPTDRPATGVGAREIELKLHVAPGDLTRLARHPALIGPRNGTASSQRLHTIYFDTPDRRLAAHGVALRVRRQGHNHVQTVKTLNAGAPGDAAAVAIRREWDWPIPSEDPDISLLTVESVRELVPQDALPDIQPLFVTDFQRTTLLVRPDPLTAIEVALDTGEIRAGVTHRPISEIELELKAGSITALFDLALRIQRIVPLRIGTESKAELGFALVTGTLPQPSKSQPLALTPATTVAEGFRHIVRNCMGHALANQASVMAVAHDPAVGDEGVHQMRVALRRLRSALGLFDEVVASPDADSMRNEVKWLANRLGPARDWDILDTAFFASYAEKKGNDKGVRLLAQAITQSRGSARAHAIEALRAPRHTTLMLGLGSWLESGRWNEDADAGVRELLTKPMADLAGGWLATRHRKSLKAGRQIRKLDDDRRHQLRISFKKLRYAVEFFRGIYPAPAVRPYLEAIETLQDLLGQLNDAATSRRLIEAIGAESGSDVKAAAKEFKEWLDRKTRRQLTELPDRWRDFEKVQPFWG